MKKLGARDAVHGFINYSFYLEALDRLKEYEKNEPTVNPDLSGNLTT